MTEETEKLSPAEALAARERQLTYQHVLAIEGNPLDGEDVAMFEMFEREGWTHEQCRAYIIEQARKAAALPAAE